MAEYPAPEYPVNLNGNVVENWDEYPDECRHCGAPADPFWVSSDWVPGDDTGICTECGNSFG